MPETPLNNYSVERVLKKGMPSLSYATQQNCSINMQEEGKMQRLFSFFDNF
jgi:hypothetical protein